MKSGIFRYWRTPVLLVLITTVVASTAIRVEWYNHAVGGFLPRPQPPSMEGNDVKWRVEGPLMAEMRYRKGIAHERGITLSERFETRRDELFQIKLTPEQQQEVDDKKRHAQLDVDFRSLISGMGCMQYLLVPLGLILSIAASRVSTLWLRTTGIVCLVVNLASGGLMLYRGYFQSLGW